MAKNRGCEHIFGDGDTCGSPGLLGERFCHYHLRYKRNQRLPTDDDYEFPILEDRDAVQLLVSDIIRGILKKKIDTKMANSLLYATQIASSNISQWKRVQDDVSIDDEETRAHRRRRKYPLWSSSSAKPSPTSKSLAAPTTANPPAKYSLANSSRSKPRDYDA